MEAATPSPFLTTSELVERWPVDRKTILAGIEAGTIPCTKVGPKRWLIPRAWVEAKERSEPEPAEPASAS
jgi:excisionase family DNA binding protein